MVCQYWVDENAASSCAAVKYSNFVYGDRESAEVGHANVEV
jgi:hypothetical protein